jgi:type IV secretory pathway VirB2 component (pilin)
MNLGTIIFGFVAMALVAGAVVFMAATTSTPISDTYGGTYGESANTTNGMLSNVTSVGSASTGYAVLIIAALGMCAGIGMLYLYGKRY